MTVAGDTNMDWGYMGITHSSNMVSIYWYELQTPTIQSYMGHLKQIEQIHALQKLAAEINFIQDRNLIPSLIIFLKIAHIQNKIYISL